MKLLLPLLGVVMLFVGCAADDGTDPSPSDDGPRVADSRFEGDFAITAVSHDGQVDELSTPVRLNFETIFGALTVEPGCNIYFGSFTLAEDGSASLTIAGGSREDCGRLAAQEELVLAALRAVDSWAEVDDGFRFEGLDEGRRVSLIAQG